MIGKHFSKHRRNKFLLVTEALFFKVFGGWIQHVFCWTEIFEKAASLNTGQIIATSHDLTPNGGLVREFPLFQGNLG